MIYRTRKLLHYDNCTLPPYEKTISYVVCAYMYPPATVSLVHVRDVFVLGFERSENHVTCVPPAFACQNVEITARLIAIT